MDLLLLMVLFLLPLLLMGYVGSRKQRKEAMRIAEMQLMLKRGDRVITTAGLYATVVSFDDDTVDLEIAHDVVTTWSRKIVYERVNLEELEAAEFDLAEAEESAETADESTFVEAAERANTDSPHTAIDTKKD